MCLILAAGKFSQCSLDNNSAHYRTLDYFSGIAYKILYIKVTCNICKKAIFFLLDVKKLQRVEIK